MEENIEMIAFDIILHSGTARSLIHDAFKYAREYKFDDFEKVMTEVDLKLTEAHKAQTGLLTKFAQGENFELNILMVHAQDHLMTTMTLKETAFEFNEIYKTLKNAIHCK
jgi:cellobiose PTS system EIIA component